jgi:hypothetical protein
MEGIRFTLGTVTVLITDFKESSYPRTPIEEGNSEVGLSNDGTPSVNGPAFPDKHLWVISAYCSATQRKLLRALRDEYHYRRRNGLDYHVLIEDYTDEFVERGTTPTRAIATGASAAEILASGSHVAYFAQYKGALIRGPVFDEAGEGDTVSFAIQETIKVEAS